jgi:hypothetical protein
MRREMEPRNEGDFRGERGIPPLSAAKSAARCRDHSFRFGVKMNPGRLMEHVKMDGCGRGRFGK